MVLSPVPLQGSSGLQPMRSRTCESKHLPATLPSPLLPNDRESDALSHPFLLVPKPRPVHRSAAVPLIPGGRLQDLQRWSWTLDGECEQPYSPLNHPSVSQAPELRNRWEFKEAT